MSMFRSVLATCLGGPFMALMVSTHLMASVTAIPQPLFIPMAEPQISLTEASGYQVIVEKSLTLRAGERRRVFGRVEIASNVNSDVYVETYTRCIGPNGFESEHGTAAQNHEGNDTPIGPSYPWPGHLALYPSLLFQAPTAGTYQCQLLAGIGDNATLTVLARDYDHFSTTWLQVSAANDAGAAWWQNLPCDMYGNYSAATSSWCLYLGGASHQLQLYVFDNDGSPPKIWQAASDAAFVDASDTLLLTTCYSGTRSCTNGNGGQDSGTVVDSHLELIQLNYAGQACNITKSPEERSTVGNHPHHYMIYHSLLAVPIYPQCSRMFKLRLSVKYVSGNPVKIDGSNYATSATHAFAINSFYGTAPPVPYLIGSTEGVARNFITGAGYAVSRVSYSLSTAPAGSVISQNPTAGIIELPGSGVNFTVSSGGAIVPNLKSLSQSSAIGATSIAAHVKPASLSSSTLARR
jgi:PASTA domain